MYVTGPAMEQAASREAGGGLGVIAARRAIVDGRSDQVFDPMLRVFLTDLIAPYGNALRDDLLDGGAGHSFSELAEPLIRSLVPADAPVDLLVLAFSMHDIRCARPTATYLSDVCPGAPAAFAICDQGSAGAFTALRIVNEYGRSGGVRRAVVVFAEQSALHYEPTPTTPPVPLPDCHAAVALLCAVSDEPVVVRQHPNVAPAHTRALLTAALAGLTEVVLIVGAGLADAAAGLADEVVVAPAGQPFTGVWWELASRIDSGRTVVLADHDPVLGYLSLAVGHD
jgi:4-hydroxymandelate oxidase